MAVLNRGGGTGYCNQGKNRQQGNNENTQNVYLCRLIGRLFQSSRVLRALTRISLAAAWGDLIVARHLRRPSLARIDDLRLGLIEFGPQHLKLATVRTGHFDPGMLAIGKNPFRGRAAARANGVAFASLWIDGACVFHALYLARERPTRNAAATSLEIG